VIQLGGNNPERLKKCALLCESLKYDEININIGCPSPKVQEGSFGACLMKTPDVVAEFTKEISETVKIPVTIKCRLGVDDFDNYEFVKTFVDTVAAKGKVKHFIVHARKAYLKVIKFIIMLLI
jgi:tRNA-dihydrouridine synthase A